MSNFYIQLDALSAVQPAANFATRDIRPGGSTPAENIPVLDFDESTIEYVDFLIRLPSNYAGGGLTVSIEWMATSATSNAVVWSAAIRRIQDDAEDVDTSHSYDYNDASADTAASASGETSKAVITFSNGADMDSLAAGESAILRIRRNASNGSDNMSGDAELVNVTVTET